LARRPQPFVLAPAPARVPRLSRGPRRAGVVVTSVHVPPRVTWGGVSSPPDRRDLDAAGDRVQQSAWPSTARVFAVAALIVAILAFGIFGVTPDGNGIAQPIDSALSATIHLHTARPTLLLRALFSPLLPALAS